MDKKIAVTGATGFLGKRLCEKLLLENNKVIAVSRSIKKAKMIIPNAFKYYEWNYKDVPAFIEECDFVIHLAGENIMAKRWTEEHKKNVIESRTLSTKALIEGIELSKQKPSSFICASGINYYGDSILPVDESSPKGTGFLSEVVDLWEKEAAEVEKFGVRRVSLRTGIVLDKYDGALRKMILPFLYFLGGPIGSGKQWFPWIHIEDYLEIIKYVLENSNLKGPINVVAPNPVQNEIFSKVLGNVLKRPSVFRVPESVLKIILGESSEAILTGVNAVPKKLIESGYKLKYDKIETALKDLLQYKV
ncbi:MAG: TIGR01777 family protein [Ignavibacteria bacterium]|nr:TIGR01777 family protein [Ignavibacteria bacterium]